MEKVELPIKTKIVAFLLLILGIIVGVSSLIQDIEELMGIQAGIFAWLMSEGLPSLTAILHGVFLLKRKKWAYISSVILLLPIVIIVTAVFAFYMFSFGMMGTELPGALAWFILNISVPLLPFILLLLDRKNFWKIAR